MSRWRSRPEIPHQLRHPLGEAEEHVTGCIGLARDGEGVGIERVVRDAADVLVKGEVRGGDALAPLLVREPLRLRPGLPVPEGEALELFEVLRRGALYGEAGAPDSSMWMRNSCTFCIMPLCS